MTEKPTRGRRWRIGDLADATGLTVRTLHHYEHVGLLAPNTRSDGNQRRYDEDDVRRLYRIIALRDLGLSLADIRRLLEDDRGALAEVLCAHLAHVDAELTRLGRLRALLERACAGIERMGEPADALAAIEAMSLVAKRVEARAAEPHETEAAWRELGAELRACMDSREPPGSPCVRPLARRARARLLEFTGGDRATLDALAFLRRWDPPQNLVGWDPALFRYLDEALACLPSSEEEGC
jgi:DNA-binding transcriptional MerR regulator